MLEILDIILIIITIMLIKWGLEEAYMRQIFTGSSGCGVIVVIFIIIIFLWRINSCVHSCAKQ